MFLQKFRGEGGELPPAPSPRAVVLAATGGTLAIAILALSAQSLGLALILGSFGASCVLLFAFPDVPFSQPRNVIGGHFLSSAIGLCFLNSFGPHWWALSLAVGTSIAVMMLTRTVHPPAGSNPVIVFLAQPAWSFLWFPTLAGAVLLVLTALFYQNASRKQCYPKYW